MSGLTARLTVPAKQNAGFKAFNAVQQAATASILNMYSQVANVTFTQITESTTQSATLRYAGSSQPSTAWGYYPSTMPEGGDAWFNSTSAWYDQPGRRQLRLADYHPRDRASARAQASADGLRRLRRRAGQHGFARIHRDELPLIYRRLDHAGAHQRDLELPADADDVRHRGAAVSSTAPTTIRTTPTPSTNGIRRPARRPSTAWRRPPRAATRFS